MATSPVWQMLPDIQAKVSVKKERHNAHSNFDYFSKADILDAVTPIVSPMGLSVVCDNDIYLEQNGWVYIKATAKLVDSEGNFVEAVAYAREEQQRKNFSQSQLTGSAATYAEKRALSNLFAIGEDQDDDSIEITSTKDTAKEKQAAIAQKTRNFIGICTSCGTTYQFKNNEHFNQFVNSPASKCCNNPHWIKR